MSGFRMAFGFRMVKVKKKKKKNFFFYIWKPDIENVRISNGSGFRMVGFRIPTIPSRRWWSPMWQSFDPRRASWTFSSLSRRFQLNDKTSEKMQVIKLTIPNHWQEYTNTGNRDLASRCSKSQPESYYNNKETSSNGRQSVFFGFGGHSYKEVQEGLNLKDGIGYK